MKRICLYLFKISNCGAWLQSLKCPPIWKSFLAALFFYPISGFALPTLPDANNLLYWFSADTDVLSEPNTAATDGVDVHIWRDQISNLEISPPAATPDRSPTYISNGIGNQPALDFNLGDGGIDALLNTSIPPNVTAQTIFMVFQPENEITSTDAGQVLIDTSSGQEMLGVGDFNFSTSTTTTKSVVGLASQSIGVGYGPAKLSAGQPHVLTAIYNTTIQMFDLYLDGVKVGNTRRYVTIDANGFTMQELLIGARSLGSYDGFEGMVGEVIFYQSSLSDTDRNEVQDYLSNKYLVPSANKAFHFSADTSVWADASGTTPITDGDDVQLWQDQSGNGVGLVPSHPGINRAATYIADGINGRPALQFNNETNPNETSPDKMQNTGYTGTLKTLFYVFQPDQSIGSTTNFTQRQVLMEGGSELNTTSPHNSVSAAHIGLNSSDGSVNKAWGYDPIDDLDVPAYPTVLSISWHDSDDQYDLRVNGASVGNLASGTDPNAFAMNGLFIGSHNSGAYGLQGKLAEIIAYESELSLGERNGIEQYLKGKYGAPNTYYVDATNGDDEDNGLSPTSPWKSFDRINTSLLIPGDTVLLKRGETWREEIDVPASGVEGSPITFRAYGLGDKPIIHGGRSVLPTDWVDMGNGIYSMTSQANVYFMGEDDELILNDSDPGLPNGNWHWDSTTSTIYYRPTSGDINIHTVDLVTTYTAIQLIGNSYIEFHDLEVTLADRGLYAKSSPSGPIHHVTISNSDFSKMEHGVFFWAVDNAENSDSIIRDNTFNNIRHSIGIYGTGNGVKTSRNFLVTRNTILNGGVAAAPQIWIDFLSGDNDGIGFQNLHDSVISHNTIIDGLGIHAGIGQFVHSDSSGGNIQYLYNHLENILGAGIVPGGQGTNSGGYTVAYNIVINSGIDPILPYGDGWGGLRLNAAQNSISKVYNNLLVGNDINIYFFAGPDNYQIYNNISYEPNPLHIFMRGNINNNVLGNNLYYPDSLQRFDRNVYGPTNFQGWLGENYAGDQEINSSVGDPGFVGPNDYHLTANSPAIDPTINIQAQDVLDLNNDYLDYDNQFMLWNPDIGPYEYQSTDTDGDGVLDMSEICFDGDCSDYDPYDSATNPSGGDLNADATDTDGDGNSDSAEIAAGTDPLDSTSGATASSVSASAMDLMALIAFWLGLVGVAFVRQSKRHET